MYHFSNPPGYRQIPLDQRPSVEGMAFVIDSDFSTPVNVDLIIKKFQPEEAIPLVNVEEEAHQKGVTDFLQLIASPEIPLIRWRRDLLKSQIELRNTFDGGAIGLIPTRLDGTAMRYYFPRGASIPEMSLIVDTI